MSEQILGRWYECMGGRGLQVKRPDREWQFAGYIDKKRGWWRVRINPYQERDQTLSEHRTIEAAEAALLERYRVTQVVEDESEPAASRIGEGATG